MVPWLPTVMPAAAASVARQAPSGKPPPMPLATAMMSGATPAHSWAKSLPVRPMPHWISSSTSRSPCASQISRRPRSVSGGSTRMPPSPWIGSMRIAAVSGPTAARTASRSPKGRWSKPGISGPKPLTIFSEPAAAMAPVERPWKAPSKATMRKRCGWPAWSKCLRAILIAHSIASVPELVKKTVSAKVASTSRRASSSWFGIA